MSSQSEPSRATPLARSVVIRYGMVMALLYFVSMGFLVITIAGASRPSYAYNAGTLFVLSPVIIIAVFGANLWLLWPTWQTRKHLVTSAFMIPTVTLAAAVAYIVLNWRDYPAIP